MADETIAYDNIHIKEIIFPGYTQAVMDELKL